MKKNKDAVSFTQEEMILIGDLHKEMMKAFLGISPLLIEELFPVIAASLSFTIAAIIISLDINKYDKFLKDLCHNTKHILKNEKTGI